MRISQAMVVLAAILTSFLMPGPAAASQGIISGRITHYENEGNYCPSYRNCTGAKYLQADYQSYRGVRHVIVYMLDSSSGAVVGQAQTDDAGYFSLGWVDLFTTGNIAASLNWYPEDANGRFAVHDSSGNRWVMWTNPFTALSGASNQSVGTYAWGSPATPNEITNVYDGAARMWNDALAQSNRMYSYFTGVDIRAFSDNNGTCPTSCTSGSDNRIYLNPGSAYEPESRVMHEMGHIASYRASRDQSFSASVDYSYPNTGTGGGWSLTSTEWSSASFEEGLATFLGDVALYGQSAVEPYTCISPGACATGWYNTETSLGSTCAAGEEREPINVVRYLRDAYDTHVDYAGETLSQPYYAFLDTINAFGNGTDNRQKDEPQCCILGICWICDQDGRSAVDFRENWKTWGTDSQTQWSDNCGPTGD